MRKPTDDMRSNNGHCEQCGPYADYRCFAVQCCAAVTTVVAPAEVAEEPDDEEAERPTQRRRIELGGWGLPDEDDDGWDAPSPNDR
eukprot:COSAG02_NODE_801_length_17030_cov_150.308428_4_plen_86_part_00